jgi:glutamate racemase
MNKNPIGVFDSGYGGLTVLKEIEAKLPDHDFLYLGDNARTPYGSRSFDTVYQYSLECVKWFFKQGCPLVILACNTASAKALRTIQQNDLPKIDRHKRVLGVIRPTAEIIGNFSKSKKVGILGTTGTVQSNSYPIEIAKFFKDIQVFQEACPMWVPLIENNEYLLPGADYFVQKHINNLLSKEKDIDVLLLACTHYPLMFSKIRQYTPKNIQVIAQGELVAHSLIDYLNRHPEIEETCSKNGKTTFYTTDSCQDFDNHAAFFYGKKIHSIHLNL